MSRSNRVIESPFALLQTDEECSNVTRAAIDALVHSAVMLKLSGDVIRSRITINAQKFLKETASQETGKKPRFGKRIVLNKSLGR